MMSSNSNSLHAMRTLLQQTQTVALDRTGAGVALDRTGARAGLILSYEPEDMVVSGNDPYRDLIRRTLWNKDECTTQPSWRTRHLKKIYWTRADWYYWTVHKQ